MRRLFPLVACVVLLDTVFFAGITPLLPEYSRDLGLSKSAAGLLSASYAAGGLLSALPGGWFAARYGAKRAVLLGLSTMTVASVAFAFAGSVELLDGARFLQGLGSSFTWAGALAWLVLASPGARRGQLIGSAMSAAIVGVLLGPVLGGAATVAGPEPIFCAVAIASLGLFAWAWVTPGIGPSGTSRLAEIPRAMLNPEVGAGAWLIGLPALFSGVLVVLASLHLDALGASGVAVGAVFLGAGIVEAILTPLLGRLSDRRGRMAPIRVGLAAGTVVALLLTLPDSIAAVAVLVAAAGATLASFWGPAGAMLSEAAERVGLDQGLAFALTNLAWSTGQVVGGSGGAALADATSDAVPYAVLASLYLVTWAAVMAGRRRGVARTAV